MTLLVRRAQAPQAFPALGRPLRVGALVPLSGDSAEQGAGVERAV